MSPQKINIEQPRWSQSTFVGRAKHFFAITNPLNLFKTPSQLEQAKDIVTRYRKGENLNISEDELWKAKHVYDSAFHPDTGEKMILVGRMSSQVPMNMLITGAMLSFYKSMGAVVFWQFVNQSYNAIVNYSNRSGDKPMSNGQIGFIYVSATSCALVTALSLTHFTRNSPTLIRRWVPFLSVCAANGVNVPLVRQSELKDGTKLFDSNDKYVGESKFTAKIGISQVILSRIVMAMPSMVMIPVMMNTLEKKGILAKYPKFGTPFQIGICGVILCFATPLGCAVFPQKASIPVSWLEPQIQDKVKSMGSHPKVLYYNKGL